MFADDENDLLNVRLAWPHGFELTFNEISIFLPWRRLFPQAELSFRLT